MKQKEFNLIFVDTIKNQKTPSSELLSHIIDSPVLSAKKAIEVYQEDYVARLSEALKNTYRGIYSLLGEEDFKILAQDFIALTPSRSRDLDDYGVGFSTFCLGHPLATQYDFLSSLASFEWDFRLLFHQTPSSGLSAEKLASAIEKGGEFFLTDSCKLLSYNFLISDLYALKDQPEEESKPFDYKKNEWIVLYKKEHFILIKSISQSQWEFLKLLENPLSMLDWFSMATDKISAPEVQQLFEFLGTAKLIELRQPV